MFPIPISDSPLVQWAVSAGRILSMPLASLMLHTWLSAAASRWAPGIWMNGGDASCMVKQKTKYIIGGGGSGGESRRRRRSRIPLRYMAGASWEVLGGPRDVQRDCLFCSADPRVK